MNTNAHKPKPPRFSAAARKRLEESELMRFAADTVKAWDYYLRSGKTELAAVQRQAMFAVRFALLHITGREWIYDRDGAGGYCIADADNIDDKIFSGRNDYELQRI